MSDAVSQAIKDQKEEEREREHVKKSIYKNINEYHELKANRPMLDPPCKYCKFFEFNEYFRWSVDGERKRVLSICNYPGKMCHDFSCYRPIKK